MAQRADPRSEPSAEALQLGAVREPQIGVELQEGLEHEPPRGDLSVRQGQPIGGQLDFAEQQQVDVDRTRAMTWPAEVTPGLGLDLLAEIEELLGLEVGPDPHRPVQKVRLIVDLPHRLRLIERGCGLDRHAVRAQALDRPAELRLAIADVGAKAEVPDAHHPASVAQTPSSSSDSRSSDRSRVTSTPASWTT